MQLHQHLPPSRAIELHQQHLGADRNRAGTVPHAIETIGIALEPQDEAAG
jgi:hypothetical protein